MRNLVYFILGAVFMVACGTEAPTEAEIRAKIVGTYCSDDYKLFITDSTYKSMKFSKGIVSDYYNIESCSNTYEIVYESDRWIIRFSPDDRPQGIKNCKAEYTLWTQQEGFLIGTDPVVMKELIDNTDIIQRTAEACD